MTPWNEADPPALPEPGTLRKLSAVVRLAAFLMISGFAIPTFLAGRYLRVVFGRAVFFHFLIARLWARSALALLGIRRRVHGRPIRAGALVANHASWLDIFVLRSIRLLYFVSKDDVAEWKGVGYVAREAGTVFIKRKRTEAKRQEAMLRERIRANQVLCFFPEATSTDGRRVLPFKSSLFSAFFPESGGADIPVQPVTVAYRVPAGQPAELYGWWGTMSFEGHIWDCFLWGWGGAVDVTFHEPVRASDFDDRKALAQHARRAVRSAMPDAAEIEAG